MERDADAALCTILTQFVAMGVVYAVGPVRPPHSAPNTNYHLLGWRSTVQTSAHERRKGTLIVRWRSDILAHLCPRQHWLWVTVEPHITGTRQRGGCCSEGGSLRPCTPSVGLGTTKPQNAQTSWSVTAAQECRSRVPGSISSGLTPTLREDWTHKRALETPCHARIASSPQDPTAMSPDHWSKLTWDTVSAGGHDLKIQQATWTGYTTVRAKESHSYSRHLIYTRHTHVIHTSCTRHTHVIHTSYTRQAHVMHTSYTRHIHVIQTSYTRYPHVMHTSYTRYPHVIHT